MNKIFIKKYVHTCVQMAHRIMIGGRAGERTVHFAKNLSITFIGGMGAFVMLFIANIVVARILGPEEYGIYAVFFAIAQIVSLLYVLELDVSALYFLAGNDHSKKETAASIMMMFGINVIVFTFLAWSIFSFFDFFSVTGGVFFGALALAFIIAAKRMIDAFLRADEQFVRQASLRVGEGIAVVVALSILLGIFAQRSYQSYAGAVMCGGVLFACVGGIYVRHLLSVKGWQTKRMNDIFRYNIFGLINATVNAAVKNADTLIIAAVLGMETAGVYAVYFTASVIIGARLTQLFINVFFPSVRSNADRLQDIIKKADRMCMRMFVPAAVCASAGVMVIVFLYGDAYPFVWQWTVLGGIYIAVHFFASLYGWILSSISREGYKIHNQSYVYGFAFYASIIATTFVIDTLTIASFLIALIVYRIVSGSIARWYLRAC